MSEPLRLRTYYTEESLWVGVFRETWVKCLDKTYALEETTIDAIMVRCAEAADKAVLLFRERQPV